MVKTERRAMEIKGIKNCRLVANKTQDDCAKEIGVSLMTFRGYEGNNGLDLISVNNAAKLAKFLACDIEDFFCEQTRQSV